MPRGAIEVAESLLAKSDQLDRPNGAATAAMTEVTHTRERRFRRATILSNLICGTAFEGSRSNPPNESC